jgi:hypothetical protein
MSGNSIKECRILLAIETTERETLGMKQKIIFHFDMVCDTYRLVSELSIEPEED